MGKHTPGPWQATQGWDGGWIIDGAPTNRGPITALGSDNENISPLERDANARLIAAAPALLEAAQAAEVMLRDCLAGDLIRAAIEAATKGGDDAD